MKAKILVLFLAVLFILPTVVLADVTAYKDQYYYAGSPTVPYEPIDPNPEATDWNPEFTPGMPTDPVILTPGDVIVLAMRNINIDTNKKLVRVYLEYAGGTVALAGNDCGAADGTPCSGEVMSETNAAGVYDLKYWIVPQPDWEYFVIENTGGTNVTINKATISTNCSPIPSLTPYGVMLLVLLMAGTAVWVMRRRSAVTAM